MPQQQHSSARTNAPPPPLPARSVLLTATQHKGLGVPCGYGTSLSSETTNAQEETGSTSSASGTYGGSCAACPPGMECPGGGVYQECEPGTHAPGGGASNVCMPCLPGTFANATAASECAACPAGE